MSESNWIQIIVEAFELDKPPYLQKQHLHMLQLATRLDPTVRSLLSIHTRVCFSSRIPNECLISWKQKKNKEQLWVRATTI